jgi:hypothetical protein
MKHLAAIPELKLPPLQIHVPRDADWKLEIHSKPAQDVLNRLALSELLELILGRSPDRSQADSLAALEDIAKGIHLAVSPRFQFASDWITLLLSVSNSNSIAYSRPQFRDLFQVCRLHLRE